MSVRRETSRGASEETNPVPVAGPCRRACVGGVGEGGRNRLGDHLHRSGHDQEGRQPPQSLGDPKPEAAAQARRDVAAGVI